MRIKSSENTQKKEKILDLKEDNTILLCDLDEDIEKQNKIYCKLNYNLYFNFNLNITKSINL